MAEKKKKPEKKEKQLRVFKGQYFAFGDNKSQVEQAVDKVNDREKLVHLKEPAVSSDAALQRSFRRSSPRISRRVPRISPRVGRL